MIRSNAIPVHIGNIQNEFVNLWSKEISQCWTNFNYHRIRQILRSFQSLTYRAI